MSVHYRSPCQYCEERVPGCHDSCEQYQLYHAECERIRARRQLDTQLNAAFYDSCTRRSGRHKIFETED